MTEDIHMGDESKTKRTDGALLRAFRTMGDEQAFADLMHRHGQMVHNTARALVGNAMEAEDIAQSTFLALARKGKILEGADSVSGWLYHVTLCLARNAYRGVIRRKAREEEAAMLAAEPDPGLFAEGVVATLYEELGKLAEKYRQPVILHHLEGLDYETAAPMCGCNGKTFSVRLTRGREQLRERMARRGVTLGAAALIAALNELPEVQRDAFLLAEEGGLTLEEIAAISGVGRETIKSRLRYATAKLRHKLESWR
jgi:RNA polymerase sigma factor (sigma-70 family)